MCGSTLTGAGRLAEICMRLSARDECVVDAVLDLAATQGWGEVRVDASQAIFVQGAVASALVFGADPLTQATCLNFLMYGAAWPFTEEGPALFRAVNELWRDPGVSAFGPAGRDEDCEAAERLMAVQERLFD